MLLHVSVVHFYCQLMSHCVNVFSFLLSKYLEAESLGQWISISLQDATKEFSKVVVHFTISSTKYESPSCFTSSPVFNIGFNLYFPDN